MARTEDSMVVAMMMTVKQIDQPQSEVMLRSQGEEVQLTLLLKMLKGFSKVSIGLMQVAVNNSRIIILMRPSKFINSRLKR